MVTKTTEMQVPMSSPDLGEAEVSAVLDVLRTPVLSIGPRVDQFERTMAGIAGRRHGIAVNSGTSGLHLAVIACGLGDGDLALTTPFSFVASANCLLYERAVPVFVDVQPDTGNIDPALVAEAADDLLGGSETARSRWLPPAFRGTPPGPLKAILPIHAFGQPADMDPIGASARHHRLALIEDSCEAIGASYRGHPAGSFGDVSVFAFYPNKQMTTGEGGMIVLDRDDLNAVCRSLRNQGRDVFNEWLEHSRLGYNYRLDEMSAALGQVQATRLDELLAKRQRVADWYSTRLAAVPGVAIPEIAPTTSRMSWFVYVVRIEAPARRRDVIERLSAQGIPSRPYFSPIHLQPFYVEKFGYRAGQLPIAERLGEESLALPFSGVMSEEQVDRVCDALAAVLRKTHGT